MDETHSGMVSASTRVMGSSEREFWEELDRGERIVPPQPCRECGLVWAHDPRCVCEFGPGLSAAELRGVPDWMFVWNGRSGTDGHVAQAHEREGVSGSVFTVLGMQDSDFSAEELVALGGSWRMLRA